MTDRLTAGVDEAGRGALAGPVVAAAVLFSSPPEIAGLTDSKRLSSLRRRELELQIKDKCACWAIGLSSPSEIERMNILQASLLAMTRAVEALSVQPQQVLIDGPHLPKMRIPARAIIKGDLSEPVISAASIIAKETRDQIMHKYSITYPKYGFEHHVGYGTKVHLRALSKFGVTAIHRKTFAPVRALIS